MAIGTMVGVTGLMKVVEHLEEEELVLASRLKPGRFLKATTLETVVDPTY